MLKSHLSVDLPSQDLLRSKGPIEWVRSLFGAKIDLRTGKEELTIGAFSLVEGLVQAFSRARLGGTPITNAISFLVDKRVVYLDPDDVEDDLKEVSTAAQKAGVFNRPFREMHLVLTHKAAGLHLLFDIGVRNQVLHGEAELQVTISARLEELNIKVGETAAQYAERVKAIASGSAIEAGRHLLDQFTETVAQQIRVSVPGSKIIREAAQIQVIRPSREQVGRMRNLEFKDGVKSARYRPVPTRARQGAYADPFYYYYHDPYFDLLNVILLSSLLSHAFHSPMVHVVDPSGQTLFTGDQMQTAEASMGDWNPAESVDFQGSDGGMSVDPDIPMSMAPEDPVEAGLDADGTPMSEEGGGGDGGGDGGDNMSSCGGADGGSDNASSCGSSCSGGSSCGSSCGGGCGGGGD